MPETYIEIAIILALILFNGIFSMAEIALVSSKITRLESMTKQGIHGARSALKLIAAPNQFLSTVQVGITLVGILSGAYGGATIAKKLRVYLVENNIFPEHAEAISVGLVVLIITYLSLIIGELVPKRIGLKSPERIASFLAAPMNLLSRMVYPLAWFLIKSSDFVLAFFGLTGSQTDQSVTGDELKSLVRQSVQSGNLERSEQFIFEKVLSLREKRLSAVMTGRPDIVFLDILDDTQKNVQKIQSSPHSYFPVVKGGLENFLGIVRVKDLLSDLQGQLQDLSANLRQPIFLPMSTEVINLLDLFKNHGTTIAMVVDEFGMIEGIVTLTDVLESIVGNLPTDGITADPEIVQLSKNSWMVEGSLAIDTIKEHLQIPSLPEETEGNFYTIAGFIMDQLRRIPKRGDTVRAVGFTFKVETMNVNRIEKVLVVKNEHPLP